jgi:stringent starvation protein B
VNGHPLPPKIEVVRALLEGGRSVFVHLDPRAIGVVVPAWFKHQAQLVLQVGFNMPIPIRDLRVDDDGMSCTLSFNRSPFFCIIPWTSVYATVGDDGRGMVWPDDVPPEVALQARQREASPTAAKQPPSRKATLAVVKNPPSTATESAKEPAPPRTLRSGADGSGKEKKPRSKKPRAEPPAPPPRARAKPKAAGVAKKGALVAVPSSTAPKRKPAAAAPPPQAAPQGRGSAGTAPETPPPAAHKTPAPNAGSPPKPGAKGKREIPPYLRVVK